MSDNNRGSTETPTNGSGGEEQEVALGSNPDLDKIGVDYTELQGVHVTVNQVIAFNMAYFRKVAGLTQEELGVELLGWTSKPWTKAAVSAAERSWDGKRIRQFDADLLYGLARTFGLPITAFFLPPADDGVKVRYLIDPPHRYDDLPPEELRRWREKAGLSFCSIMADLYSYAMSSPSDEDHPIMEAYRSRLVAARAMYEGNDDVLDADADLTTYDQLVDRAARLRRQYDQLRELAGDVETMLENTYERIRENRPAGRAPRRSRGLDLSAPDDRAPSQRGR